MVYEDIYSDIQDIILSYLNNLILNLLDNTEMRAVDLVEIIRNLVKDTLSLLLGNTPIYELVEDNINNNTEIIYDILYIMNTITKDNK